MATFSVREKKCYRVLLLHSIRKGVFTAGFFCNRDRHFSFKSIGDWTIFLPIRFSYSFLGKLFTFSALCDTILCRKSECLYILICMYIIYKICLMYNILNYMQFIQIFEDSKQNIIQIFVYMERVCCFIHLYIFVVIKSILVLGNMIGKCCATLSNISKPWILEDYLYSSGGL